MATITDKTRPMEMLRNRAAWRRGFAAYSIIKNTKIRPHITSATLNAKLYICLSVCYAQKLFFLITLYLVLFTKLLLSFVSLFSCRSPLSSQLNTNSIEIYCSRVL